MGVWTADWVAGVYGARVSVVLMHLGLGWGACFRVGWDLDLGKERKEERIRRPLSECGLVFVSIAGIYGVGRTAFIETVLMFAQVVYLMMPSAYVCKETM